ncbi:MAG TPA: sigma-70 family RNA polymerase sigma factor, partial [Kofleriaceae bacterium]
MAASKKSRSKRASKVIDVGDKPAAGDGDTDGDAADSDEEATDKDEGLDTDLATAGTIDVGETSDEAPEGTSEHDDDVPRVPAKREAGSLARRDPLSTYMSETRRYPLLTPDEERSLAIKLVEHSDTSAARKLIEANLRLVVKIAYEYRRAHRNLLDLVQEGNIGLIQAVGKFDPYRGVKLSSYAAFWIRAYILKFILNNWRLVKIGTTQAQRKLFFNLRKEQEKLLSQGFEAAPKLLAEKLDVSEQDVR